MNRFLPKSLFGQTILILLLGLVVSHAIGAWIYAGAREQAVRAIGGFAAAQRVANLSRLVEEAPTEWRSRIVGALSDPTFRVSLAAQPPEQLPADAEEAAKAIEDYVRQQLPERPDRQVRAAVFAPSGRPPFGPPFDRRPGPMGGRGGMGPMMPGMMGPDFGGWRGLQVAVLLSDGQWLSFATALPQGAPSVSWQFIISLALMGLIVLARLGMGRPARHRAAGPALCRRRPPWPRCHAQSRWPRSAPSRCSAPRAPSIACRSGCAG